jgi:hypothetical protein
MLDFLKNRKFFEPRNYKLPPKHFQRLENLTPTLTADISYRINSAHPKKASLSLITNKFVFKPSKTQEPDLIICIQDFYYESLSPLSPLTPPTSDDPNPNPNPPTPPQTHTPGFLLKTQDLTLEILLNTHSQNLNFYHNIKKLIIQTDIRTPYSFLEKLDQGGFSTVYKAKNNFNGEIVAMKMIFKKKIENQRFYNYTINEINYMRELSHPNIIKIYEVFDLDNFIALAVENLDGGNLSTRISGGLMSEKIAFGVLKEILECLSYLHSKDIVHRDLKPANIMFKKNLEG